MIYTNEFLTVEESISHAKEVLTTFGKGAYGMMAREKVSQEELLEKIDNPTPENMVWLFEYFRDYFGIGLIFDYRLNGVVKYGIYTHPDERVNNFVRCDGAEEKWSDVTYTSVEFMEEFLNGLDSSYLDDLRNYIIENF